MMNTLRYKIIRSSRRTISVRVDSDANVVVRAPYLTSDSTIDSFVNKHADWISKAVDRASVHKRKYLDIPKEQEKYLRERARHVINDRLKYFSSIMNLYPTGVRITSAKKRYGSCSAKDSLNFSWRLMLYDDDVVDYVIVHELAHIKYKNHGRDFYKVVSEVLPDYRETIKKLRND